MLSYEILTHGIFPRKLGQSIIHPITKSNTKSIHDSFNYKPISFVPIIAQILIARVAKIIDNEKAFHANQIGFTRNKGCDRALFGFRSVLKCFRQKNSNVNICSLCLTNAFD